MDLGLHLAYGSGYRTVGYVEREAYAATVLVARMADEALARAPIWDDLSTFEGGPYRGSVDLVSAGLPCQPYSLAGKRKGHADDRALWPHFVRIVRECEPALVFVENVPSFRKHFEPVWRGLRELGFEWAPPLLQTATESGAPHIRQRFFALAAHPERLHRRHEPRGLSGQDRAGAAGAGVAHSGDPDADGQGLERWRLSGRERPDERAAGAVRGAADADTDGGRCEGEWCGWVFDGERETLRHDADRLRCRCRIRRSPWSSESPPVRVADGPATRVDELRAIGNVGTPPLVYADAFLTLLESAKGIRA